MADQNLIAPCGMNCAICSGHLRENKPCPGCNFDDKDKTKLCIVCKIKNCTKRTGKFCFDCTDFPCDLLKHLDARYQKNYHMSEIENLQEIKKNGINKFIVNQEKKWACPKCGNLICCHNGLCYFCDQDKLKAKKHKYRWEE
jgi:hypothetical protein